MAKNSNRKKSCKRISGIDMLKCQHEFLKSHLTALNQLKEKLSNLKK
jgi:hypothetical protein